MPQDPNVPEGGFYDQQYHQNNDMDFANFHEKTEFMKEAYREQTLWKSIKDAGHQHRLDMAENAMYLGAISAGVSKLRGGRWGVAATIGAGVGVGVGYLQQGWDNLFASDISVRDRYLAQMDLSNRGAEFTDSLGDAIFKGGMYALTSPLGMVGGFAVAEGVNSIYDSFTASDRRSSYFNMKSFTEGLGHQLIRGGASTNPLGTGFNHVENHQAAAHMVNLGQTFDMGDSELQSIISMMANNDMLNGVGGIQQFKEKTTKLMENFKLLIDTVGATQEQAVQIMGQMDQVGIGGQNAFKMMNHANMISGQAGMPFGQIHQRGMEGAMANQGSGFSAASGYMLNSSLTSAVSTGVSNGFIDQNTQFQMGGAEGISKMLFQNTLRSTNTPFEKLAGLYAFNADTRKLDVDRYREAMGMGFAQLSYEANTGGVEKLQDFNMYRQDAYSHFMENGGGDLVMANQLKNIRQIARGLPGGATETNIRTVARNMGFNNSSFDAMIGSVEGAIQNRKSRFNIDSIQEEEGFFESIANYDYGVDRFLVRSGIKGWWKGMGDSSYADFLAKQNRYMGTYEDTGVLESIGLTKGSAEMEIARTGGLRNRDGFLTISDDPTDMRDFSEIIASQQGKLEAMGVMRSFTSDEIAGMKNKDRYRYDTASGMYLDVDRHKEIADNINTMINDIGLSSSSTQEERMRDYEKTLKGIGLDNLNMISKRLGGAIKRTTDENGDGSFTEELRKNVGPLRLDVGDFKDAQTFFELTKGARAILGRDKSVVIKDKEDAQRIMDQYAEGHQELYFENIRMNKELLNSQAIRSKGDSVIKLQQFAQSDADLTALNFTFNDINEAQAFLQQGSSMWYDTDLEKAEEHILEGLDGLDGLDRKLTDSKGGMAEFFEVSALRTKYGADSDKYRVAADLFGRKMGVDNMNSLHKAFARGGSDNEYVKKVRGALQTVANEAQFKAADTTRSRYNNFMSGLGNTSLDNLTEFVKAQGGLNHLEHNAIYDKFTKSGATNKQIGALIDQAEVAIQEKQDFYARYDNQQTQKKAYGELGTKDPSSEQARINQLTTIALQDIISMVRTMKAGMDLKHN